MHTHIKYYGLPIAPKFKAPEVVVNAAGTGYQRALTACFPTSEFSPAAFKFPG